MNPDLYQALSVAVTQIFLGVYVMLLVEFRQPARTWMLRWMILAGGMVAFHVIWIGLGHFDFYSRFGVLTLVLPYILATIWCSRYKGFRTVFSVANGFYVGCICGVNGYVAQALVPQADYLSLGVRIISLILLYFALKKFARTCRKMLHQLDYGWMILCLIPITTSLLTLYTNRVFFRQDPFPAALILYGLLLVCACSYYLMYLFFERVQKENEARHSAQLSALQLSAFQSRMEAVRSAEDTIRTQRHDLRHRLQTAVELVSRGDRDEALEFLNAAQKRLDEDREIRWCRPPVLDAVFSSYFDQAKNQGIPVEAKISLPDTLPVDEGDLAVVLANALENAIHANLALPYDKRDIFCKMVGAPGVMLEISNPCAGDISFDSSGLPMPQKEGHGLGVQSISAFCKKNDAVCQFDLAEGRFCFRLVL